jgi:hypothetical protein
MRRLLAFVLVAITIALSADVSAQKRSHVGPLSRARIPQFTADMATSYDAGWQSAMFAKVQAILADPKGYSKTTGKACHFGDSMTATQAQGYWPRPSGAGGGGSAGASASDLTTIAWMHADAWDTSNGWFLAGGIELTATAGAGWTDGWIDTNLNDSRVTDCQFIFWMFNDPGGPGTPDLSIVQTRIDQSIARGMVPLLVSMPPRYASGNTRYDLDYTGPYNAALKAKAQANAIPYIGFNEEVVRRRPNPADGLGSANASWMNTMITSDGVHPTASTTGFTIGTDPYANGGSSTTHMSGALLANSGYSLLTVMEIWELKKIKVGVGL